MLLLLRKAPIAAPRMMTNSLGCHSSSRLPPSMTKLPRTLARTSTDPMIANMRSHTGYSSPAPAIGHAAGFLKVVASRRNPAGGALPLPNQKVARDTRGALRCDSDHAATKIDYSREATPRRYLRNSG